jgi:hypothetical protein
VCQDAAVFGAVLGLDGPPTWKVKKMTPEEFQEVVGQIVGSVRCVVHCLIIKVF